MSAQSGSQGSLSQWGVRDDLEGKYSELEGEDWFTHLIHCIDPDGVMMKVEDDKGAPP